MGLDTFEDRKIWLNTLLETVIAGESFLGASKALLVDARASGVYNDTVLNGYELFVNGDYQQAMCAPVHSESFFGALSTFMEEGYVQSNAVQFRDASAFFGKISEFVLNWSTACENREEAELYLLLVAMSSMYAFSQPNIAGIPQTKPKTVTPAFALLLSLLADNAKMGNDTNMGTFARECLKANQEDVFACVPLPMLLLISRCILTTVTNSPIKAHIVAVANTNYEYNVETLPSVHPSSLFSVNAVGVLLIRVAWIHGQSLVEHTQIIREELLAGLYLLSVQYQLPLLNPYFNVDKVGIQDVIATSPFSFNKNMDMTYIPDYTGAVYPSASVDGVYLASYIRSLTCSETSCIFLFLYHYTRSHLLLISAGKIGEFYIEFTGKMGKKTRYQMNEHAQLVTLPFTKKTNTHKVVSAPVSIYETSLYDCKEDTVGNVSVKHDNCKLSMKLMDSPPDADLETFDDTYLHSTLFNVSEDEPVVKMHEVEGNIESLTYLASLAMASQIMYIRATRPRNELDLYEQLAYINTILQKQREVCVDTAEYNDVSMVMRNLGAWCVNVVALQTRSLVELSDHRRQIRSMAQFETVSSVYMVNTLDKVTDYGSKEGLSRITMGPGSISAATSEEADRMMMELQRQTEVHGDNNEVYTRRCLLSRWRLQGGFVVLTPWWSQRKVYGDLCLGAGLKQTSLEAYIQIGLWSMVIDVLLSLGRKSTAERLVRAKLRDLCGDTPEVVEGYDIADLESKIAQSSLLSSTSAKRLGFDMPEHQLWHLLGDIKQDPKYWQKAWDLSGESFPRSKRALGLYYYNKSHYEKAYMHLRDALALNPSHGELWFLAGASAQELYDFTSAAECFSRAVEIQPDYAEAWNNLAACHLHCKMYKKSLVALEHAGKYRRSSWRIWENYLNCAVKLGDYQKIAYAVNILTDLYGNTDSNTLIQVKYSESQIQYYLGSIGLVLDEAIKECKTAVKKELQRKSNETKTVDQGIMQQSFLAHQTNRVLDKLEIILTSMCAREKDVGGRLRGGGVEAGEANSFAAAQEHREKMNQIKDMMEQGDKYKYDGADADIVEVEEDQEYIDSDVDEEELLDGVGALKDVEEQIKQLQNDKILSDEVLSNTLEHASVLQKFRMAMYDMMMRLNMALWRYLDSIEAANKQILISMESREWQRNPAVHKDLVFLFETVLVFIQRISAIEQNVEEDKKTKVLPLYNDLRLKVSKVITSIEVVEKEIASTKVEFTPMSPPFQTILARVESFIPATEVVATEEVVDKEYAAYMDDNMDSYW